MNIGLIVVVILIAVFAYYIYSKKKNVQSVPGASTTLLLSDSGALITSHEGLTFGGGMRVRSRDRIHRADGFSTLFPDMTDKLPQNGGYPVYSMINFTQDNVKLVNDMNKEVWALVINPASACAENNCKKYAIKNKGQFRVHLDNYKKWLDSLNNVAFLTYHTLIKEVFGFEYDFDRGQLFNNQIEDPTSESSVKSLVLPITSKNTPLLRTKTIPRLPMVVPAAAQSAPTSTLAAAAAVVEGLAAVANTTATVANPVTNTTTTATPNATETYPVFYVIYSTYTMLLMEAHKAAGKDINVNFDSSWEPISAEDYNRMEHAFVDSSA